MRYLFLILVLAGAPYSGHASGAACPLEKTPSEINYAFIKNVAKDQTSLSGFIRSLPEALRSRFVLVYRSESLQYASAVSPRVILFNEDATLLLAYSGAESYQSHGVGTAEMIVFNPLRCAWDFHQIRFSRILEEESKEGDAPQFDGSMPCASCHRGRPIWDTYSLWPGFFGSYDDGMKVGTPEASFYETFTTEGSKGELYSSLIGLGGLTQHKDLSRFNIDRIMQRPGYEDLPDRPYYLLHENTKEKTELFHYQDGIGGSADYPNGPRPLEKLSVELTKLNSARIAHDLVASGIPKADLLSLLAALIGCHNFEKILPQSIKVNSVEMDVLRARVEGRGLKYFEQKLRRMKDAEPMTEGREKHFESKARLVEMKARILKILAAHQMDMDDWSLTRQRDSLSFFHSNYSIDMMIPFLGSYFDDPSLKGLGFPYARAYEHTYCGVIEEISRTLDSP